MLFTQKFRPMNLVITYQVFEFHALAALIPWVLMSMIVQTKIIFYGEQIHNGFLITVLFNVLGVTSFIGYVLH